MLLSVVPFTRLTSKVLLLLCKIDAECLESDVSLAINIACIGD